MTIYVFFPVAVFYYYNLPDLYEKRVEAKRVCVQLPPVMDSLMCKITSIYA